MVTEKPCTRCGEVKPLEAFSPLEKGKYGRCAHCKACRSKRNAADQSAARGREGAYLWPRHADERAADAALNGWRYPTAGATLRLSV